MLIGDVKIYTDGACCGNPGPGGWGYCYEDAHSKKILGNYGSDPETTNNRMEMMAVIQALERFQEDSFIEIYSDSAYFVNGATKWILNWIKNGWVNSGGQSVKNVDLWKRYLQAAGRHNRVHLFWVKGHSGDKLNEIADKLAVKGAQEAKNDC